ncbi:unnamed protein product [Arctia plantaginis]|uniref:Chitinase n=1 Tax=Arctia plantaginis TaxID=874455 RepID=A0A8S0Z9T8_ARCPL|nr:unnamed protein product [Arctia plantaginis]
MSLSKKSVIAQNALDLRSLLKSKHVQGFELHDVHKSLNKTKVTETVEAARSAIASSGGGPLFLALPAHPELLAKYYDLRTMIKKVDLLMVETHNLGVVKKMTYHPSRLSGMWDMMNTDSVVDLVVGLGVPASKVVISLPATAHQFTLVNETLSTPGSPTVDDEPKEIDQAELCRQLKSGRWTLERDQDLSAPYAFKDKTWISFEDSSSVDVKGKYARVRGLAGLALHRTERDVDTTCGPTLRAALAKVLNQQSRAPRAAVLRSLENEILSVPSHVRALNALQVSPYRITQIVDSDGVIHSIREDTRTEFSCSRQGYFVHPRSCARFYRCVKFDQLSPEYTVFEFDCPAGLAFDSRYEVCVWPGSLPHSQACPGSSEIAPVPKTRFICPEHEGYYADPENCRWFFACLDHGTSPLTAYEFRCPFGLGFDAERLKCDWPWLVPNCGNIGRYEAEAHGFSAALLTGAGGFNGHTADAINVAAHQSLVSGASLDNLVGIQGGYLTKNDALDSNFITSQELNNAAQAYDRGHDSSDVAYQVGDATLGLVQPTQYNNQGQYSSGSIILDDYRLPTKEELAHKAAHNDHVQAVQSHADQLQGQLQSIQTIHSGTSPGQTTGYNKYSGTASSGYGQYSTQYKSNNYDDDSGKYIHDPSGDHAEPYKHQDSPTVPYIHNNAAYKQSSEYYDYGKYSGSYQDSGYFGSQYVDDNSGQYVEDNSGAYVERNSASGGYQGGYTKGYNADYSGFYQSDDSGKYSAGVYRTDGHIGNGKATSSSNSQQYHRYSEANAGNYVSDAKALSGSPHILTAGAINVGLVGKTTLIDAEYKDQSNYHGLNPHLTQSYSHSTQTLHPSHIVSHVSQPAVSISHVGTDENNLDGYNYVTTPTSSGIPTTATPFAATTSLPVVSTYKTTFVPQAPKTSIKQVFGISQPALTYVEPTRIAVKQLTPQVDVSDHKQGVKYHLQGHHYSSGSYNGEDSKDKSGYVYSKPSINFEDGISYTTTAPAIAISTYKPESFSHNQGSYNQIGYGGIDYSYRTPVYEEPIKKAVAYTTGDSVNSFAQPTASSYTPHSFSHQTVHKIESSNTYVPSVQTDYEYSKSQVVYEEPKIIQYTAPQPTIHVQPVVSKSVHEVDTTRVNAYSGESGYNYAKPSVPFAEAKTIYSTPAPIVTSTYKPQIYSHQTVHKIEAQNYVPVSTTPKYDVSYQSTPVTLYDNPFVKYTQDVTPVTYTKPSYTSNAVSHQTIHKVENINVYRPANTDSGYEYTKSPVTFQEQPREVEYTTVQPSVSSTYQPQVYSHQTLHKVDANRVNTHTQGFQGYEYQQPVLKFEEKPKTSFEYSTPAPIITTYQPQVYSQQTVHKVDASQVNSNSQASNGYEYQHSAVNYEEAPKTIFEYTTPEPAVTTYQPQVYNHQTLHKVNVGQVNGYSEQSNGYNYQQAAVKFEEAPKTTVEYSTPAPIVTTTYQPHVFSHQTLHKVDASQVQTYSQDTDGYEYKRPAVKFVEQPKSVFKYSTPSAAQSQSFSHQTVHKVERQKYTPVTSTFAPKVDITYQQAVTTYENPILKYTQKETPVTYVQPTEAVYTQTYKPIIQQHEVKHIISEPVEYQQNRHLNLESYSYSQPEIQRNVERSKGYSDASVVSHQYYHQSNKNQNYESGKVIVSTSPSTLIYEDHYSEYKSPNVDFKAPEYIPPKNDYKLYSTASTASTPVVHESSVIHQAQEYIAPKTYSETNLLVGRTNQDTQGNYEYKAEDYSQQYETVQNTLPAVQHVSFSTSHVAQPEKVESIHFSFPSTTPKTQYQQYQSPEIQVAYKSEEYLPPVVSTATPIITSTYKPRTYSTVSNIREYLPPAQPKVKSTTPSYRTESTTAYQASEYLPPVEANGARGVSFSYNDGASQGHHFSEQAFAVSHASAPVHKHNIVVETAKSHLLGFGTVGPDAGLVSARYTTAAPLISSTYKQRVKSTTPTYRYKSTTDYQAPEYLPPSEEVPLEVDVGNFGYKNTKGSYSNIQINPYQEATILSTAAPIYRKQNIVVKTAKSHLLNYERAGSDAGLVSPVSYTTSSPVVSSSESYSLSPKPVTSIYSLEEQGLFEVTPSTIPIRKTRPKVAVVTKINDFNPFLIRKLGAVCSCQSPVLILKGKRPTQQPQDIPDYNDSDNSGRGDINGDNYKQRYTKVQAHIDSVATPAPIVSSTFNPIIVPDDSFYQDLQEQNGYDVAVTPKHSESYISNMPIRASTTLKPIRIRNRVKAVTVAPTYETVLLNQNAALTTKAGGDSSAGVEAQAFDRYGPGGWRSRDETLQGSVDCKRAGLFRHPKQCNKFYACRWDCTKQRFTLHVFNCPIQLSFDPSIGACNWPSQGPACQGDTLLTNVL